MVLQLALINPIYKSIFVFFFFFKKKKKKKKIREYESHFTAWLQAMEPFASFEKSQTHIYHILLKTTYIIVMKREMQVTDY
jgi:hypothetical protein